MFPSSNRRAGFTLIELLVVIAIIAILAAVLFPVFILAQKNARKSGCQSHLKQLGNAAIMYLDDSNGVWLDQRPYTIAFYKYLKNRNVFKCPEDALRDKLGASGPDSERVSYLRNSETFLKCSGGVCVPKPLHVSEIAKPSGFVVLVDDDNRTAPATWSSPVSDSAFHAVSQTGRHSGQDNYLLGDGHIKSVASTDIAEGASVYSGITWDPSVNP